MQSFYTVIKHLLKNTETHLPVTSALEFCIMDVRLSERATLEQLFLSTQRIEAGKHSLTQSKMASSCSLSLSHTFTRDLHYYMLL